MIDKKNKLGRDATAALKNVMNSFKNIDKTDSYLRNALEFLKRAADSERKKETMILQSYWDKIKLQIPKNQQGKYSKTISQIKNIDLKNPTVEDYKAYLDLITLINYTRNGYEETLRRLKLLEHHKKTNMTLKDYKDSEQKDKELFRDLYKDDIRFSGEQAILSLLGEASSSGSHQKSIFSKNFRNAIKNNIFIPEIIEKFNRKHGNGIITTAQLQGGLLASIGADLLQVLQEQLNIQGKEDFIQLENVDQIVANYFENYKKRTNLTRFQTALLNNSTELDRILDSAIRDLGIEELETIKEVEKRNRQIKYRDKKYDIDDKKSFKNILESTGNKSLLKNFRKLKFKVVTNTSHGNFMEFFEQFISSSISDKSFQSRTGQGVDEYAIGSVTCYIDTDDFVDYVDSVEKAIIQARNGIRKAVENDQTERLKQMNKSVIEAEKVLTNKIKEVNKLDSELNNVFIYHESFKLSKSAEVGLKSAFKGREMAILNYIDTIYTIPQDILTLPDKENLYFLALNLAEAASGPIKVKDILRHYLSVFAGLLMFDDVEHIATDIEDNLSLSVVKNIHLYNLNGIYVPSSIILSYTYTQMMALYNLSTKIKETSGMGAAVTIVSAAANKKIKEVVSWTDNQEYPDDGKTYSYHWYELANDVASGTTVRIAFLSGFLKLIDDLSNPNGVLDN